MQKINIEQQKLSLQKSFQSSAFKKKVFQMSNQTLDKICKDLDEKHIQISIEKKPFILKQTQKPRTPKKLQEMRKKKELVQMELKYIQMEENKLKQSHLSNTSFHKFRSQFSKDELIKIRQVIKSQNQFIKSLQQKQKSYFESLEIYRKQKIALEEKSKAEKCQQRLKQLSLKMEELSKLQEQRKLKFKLDQERLDKVRNQKRLHEELEQKQNQKLKDEEQKIKRFTQSLRRQNKFNLDDINRHHKNYETLNREQQEKRMIKNLQFKSKQKLNLPKIIPSKFFTNLKQEDQIRKTQQQKKAMQKQELILKKQQYNRIVKQKHKPKQKTKNQEEDIQLQQDQTVKKSPLQLQQIINLGNDYMKQVHSKIKRVSQSQSKITTLQEFKSQRPQYKNYLNDLKSKNGKQNRPSNKLQEIKRLMNDINLSEQQKIQKAKLIAKTLQKKQHKNKDLIKSINAKLQILNQMSK